MAETYSDPQAMQHGSPSASSDQEKDIYQRPIENPFQHGREKSQNG